MHRPGAGFVHRPGARFRGRYRQSPNSRWTLGQPPSQPRAPGRSLGVAEQGDPWMLGGFPCSKLSWPSTDL